MSERWNIQVSVQRVVIEESTRSTYNSRRPGAEEEAEPRGRRDVTDVASLKVTADSEVEAFRKAQRLLIATLPAEDDGNLEERVEELLEARDVLANRLDESRAYANKLENQLAEERGKAIAAGLKSGHLHRASCDDSAGNLVCGYPADGPSIGGNSK